MNELHLHRALPIRVLVFAAMIAVVGCDRGAGDDTNPQQEESTSSDRAAVVEEHDQGNHSQTEPGRDVIDADTYYANIDPDSAGDDLKAQLNALIAGHRAMSYGALWEALAYTDADPEREGFVLLFYTGWSRSDQLHGGQQSEWNREHVWAKSRGGFGTSPPMGTDLHYIRPTDVSVNHERASLAFDDGGELYVDGDGATDCRRDRDSWEPRDAVKGDVARMLFYSVVRYENPSMDFELIDTIHSAGDRRALHGVLSTLLEWHEADPPDAFEKRRNNRIFELQGNRNPFIDHPQWVDRIWAG